MGKLTRYHGRYLSYLRFKRKKYPCTRSECGFPKELNVESVFNFYDKRNHFFLRICSAEDGSVTLFQGFVNQAHTSDQDHWAWWNGPTQLKDLNVSAWPQLSEVSSKLEARFCGSPANEANGDREEVFINELENEPAYLRRGVQLDNVPRSGEHQMSKWTIGDEDEPEMRRGNAYLHDQVD